MCGTNYSERGWGGRGMLGVVREGGREREVGVVEVCWRWDGREEERETDRQSD